MNLHMPQSIVAATELKYLATVLRQIISPRKNSPIIEIVQDTMTGSYRITDPNIVIPEHIAMNILARTKKPLSLYKKRKTAYTGLELFSSTLPLLTHKNNVTIQDGVITKGRINKGTYSKTSEGIIHVLYNDFGPDRCAQFINDVQNIVTKFNLYSGFSTGVSDLVSSSDTLEEIQTLISNTKKEVSDLISSVHSGMFINNSGRQDGDELENKISTALNSLSNKISDLINKNISNDNRMKQMVDSGAKGSYLNIMQMVALLGQQNVAGKRIQYTLQDRTLPHFARYDTGPEARGFVENSFISGIRPAEFFFHAMGGREGLIDTAIKTSDSGYIQRKLVKNMEDLHVEYDGTVRNVNGTIIQFHYGGNGIDTICIEKQPCNLGTMTLEQIYSNYAATPDEYKMVVSGDIPAEIPDMVDQIIQDRDVFVKNVLHYVYADDTVFAPVHIKRITEKYRNPYSVKTDLTPQYVVAELTKFCDEKLLKHNKVFHILLRFYLAPKKSILDLRLTKEMFVEILKEIRFKYMKSLVQPGEMVGVLAAQSIGEPTTQLTLNSFHSAGTIKANATQGVPRIAELLSATHNQKSPLNFIYLNAPLCYSQDAVMSIKRELQKTTLRDITQSIRIYYDPSPLSTNTAVQEDLQILKTYEKFSVTQGSICASPWIMRLELDRHEMAARNTLDMAVIAAKIQNNKVLRVFECVMSDTNSPDKIVLRITFTPDIVKNALSLRFIEDKLLDTVITGIEGIGRVFPTEIQNRLVYENGDYSAKKQYCLIVEGTNLLDVSRITSTNPYKNYSNDIHEIYDIFGIEAARVCLYREFVDAFTTEYINYAHIITLVDSMTTNGYILSVERSGVNKNEELGILAKSSFEETAKHLFNAAISADFDNMKGVSANIMFGQKPPCGTGFVDILIDETKLPEGPDEEESVFDTEIQAVNTRIEESKTTCDMNDILMDW